MKLFTKILSAALAAVLLIPTALTACSTDENKNKDSENDDPGITIFADGKSDYTIVRTEKIDNVVLDAIIGLRKSFTEKFGAEPDIASDWVKKGEEIPTENKEILIGATNRAESVEAMKNLKPDTFEVKVVGNKLVIVADSTVMLVNAINYFVKNYVTTATDSVVLPSDMLYVGNLSDYAPIVVNSDGSTKLNLESFVVTYDKEGLYSFIDEFAEVFETKAEAYGGILGVTDDDTVNDYVIMLGACEREDFVKSEKELLFRDYAINVKGSKVSIDAISIYGFERAMDFLLDGMSKGDLVIPEGGIFSEFDYGTGTYADLVKNYENPSLDGAWMVNVCHRGDVTSNLPENSIPAYQSCIDNKVDVIETDLKMTKDGVWVVCHDKKVDRTTNGSGTISSMNYSQIQKLTLKTKNGGSGSSATKYRMPTLIDIIELCHGKTLFNLDHLNPSQFQSVYDVFEKENAVDMAMFKTTKWSASDLTKWFCELMLADRELPLFSPMLYSNTVDGLRQFRGLTSMTETGNGHSIGTAKVALECNIRLMCLTALSPELENVEYWTKLTESGYNAIMTDEPIKLKEFIHGK